MSITIRPAPPLDSYPPIRRTAPVQGVRVEPCACGAYIHQLPREFVVDTVRRHNATATHQGWRGGR